MKLIIAGPRDLFVEPLFIRERLIEFEIYDQITEVVSGKATGIDTCGENWVEYEFLSEFEYQHRCDINHKIREIRIK